MVSIGWLLCVLFISFSFSLGSFQLFFSRARTKERESVQIRQLLGEFVSNHLHASSIATVSAEYEELYAPAGHSRLQISSPSLFLM